MLLIDHYAYNNKLAGVHPGEKFLFFAVTVALCLALPTTFTTLVVTLLMAGAVVFAAGVPWRFYLKLLLLPGAFLAVGVAAVAVSVTRSPQDFIWAIHTGQYFFGITRQGLDNSVNLFLRSLGAVSCLYFLSLTTPMTEIADVLRKMRVPTLVIELMTLIYRFIFILLEVTGQIYTAQSSRLGYKNARTGFHSLSRLVLSIFIKSYRQSQAMYDSLVSRCYSGNLHILTEPRQWCARNILLIVTVDGALLLCSLYAGGLV
jgi:cobalt/nickel transport system permease protein